MKKVLALTLLLTLSLSIVGCSFSSAAAQSKKISKHNHSN